MNKKLWIGAYLVSLLIVVAALLVEAVLGVLGYDEIVRLESVIVTMIFLGVLAYVQFVIVHTIITLSMLYKIWDAIQDGVTAVTPGKAIGFLFIPFYNLYWIFRVWAGYAKDHNDFVNRHSLRAPQLTGTVFTMFPIIVLLTAIFILPVLILPFFTLFLIARACDAVNNLSIAKSAVADVRPVGPTNFIGTPENPRSRMPIYAFAAAFLMGGVFILGFGVFSWFNLKPSPTVEEVPAKVGEFNLQPGGGSSGSFLGGRKQFWGHDYISEAGGSKKAIEYNVDVFSSDAEPQRWITSMCSSNPSGVITDTAGKDVGKICVATYAVFLQQRNNTMRIRPPDGYDLKKLGSAAATPDEIVAFARALPLNAGLVFPEIATTSTSTTNSTTTSSNSTPSLSKDSKPDFTMTGAEFYNATNGKDKATLSKYEGKIIQVTARQYSTVSSSVMLQAGKNSFFGNFEPGGAGPFEQAKKDDRLTIKCVGIATSSLRLDRCILIENKKIVAAEDTPEVTFTAEEYWDAVASYNLSSATRNKKWDELRGKIVKISGKFKNASGDTANLAVGDTNSITCKLDPENVGMLSGLAAGQNVTFLAVHGVTSPEHCIVINN